MNFEGYDFPDDRRYHVEHCWAKLEGPFVVVGLTEFVIAQAGEIAHVKLLEPDEDVELGKQFGSIETGKYMGKLYSPISGTIAEVNEEALDDPMIIAESPYEDGWLMKVRPSALSEMDELMTTKDIPGFIGKKIEELKEKGLYKAKK